MICIPAGYDFSHISTCAVHLKILLLNPYSPHKISFT